MTNSSTQEGKSSPKEKKEPNRNFFVKHPLLLTVVIAAILVAAVYGTLSIRNRQVKVNHAKELVVLRDSLSLNYRQNNVRIFSWAVRGEVSRNNIDQVETLFINYLQTDDIVRVVLIKPEDGSIIVSTNKIDNDTLIDDKEIINASSIVAIDKGSTFYIVNPIMGLDRKTGILLVEINK